LLVPSSSVDESSSSFTDDDTRETSGNQQR
jgi:hypothetical protein